jgi:hypothetical protein
MRSSRTLLLTTIALVVLTFGILGCRAQKAEAKDPIAAEIQRLSADPKAEQIRPVLGRAEEDLRQGRRVLVLQRLLNARKALAESSYMGERSAAERKEMAGFEAEWKRMGTALRADLGNPSAVALEEVEPAALRALGEAALPQVRVYYNASLDYGRSTAPDSGLYYLSTAQAQREVVAASRDLSTPSGRKVPPVRSLEPELDALQGDLLAAYRPPASIDRHGEFITASSTLKEARELDAAGLRYGALLKYLQAVQLAAPLHPARPPLAGETLAVRLRDLDGRLSAGKFDHSLGRLFLDMAQAEPAGPAATVIAEDVIPRYFAALEPAPSRTPRPAPQVTVTLVRWPYT